jgi:predicted acylesterase/phospholipase RssA
MSSQTGKPDKKLGLCLAGGGGLGFLHVGLLEAMEQLGIRPEVVAGTSSGAAVGAFYASGKSALETREILDKFRWTRIVAPTLIHRRGINSTSRMQSFFTQHLGKINIEDLPIRLKIAAINLIDGTLVGFTRGPLAKCLAAASAVPGVFEPVRIKDGIYYDAGGIFNLPLELFADENVDIIIAANTIGRNGLMANPGNIQDTYYQAYLIRCMHQSLAKLGPEGWLGRKNEKLVYLDYPTHGVSPSRMDEVLPMIGEVRELAVKILSQAHLG